MAMTMAHDRPGPDPAPAGQMDAGRRRVRARVAGVVQGVGFRPHVYRLAEALELAGFVRNDARGVLLEVEGSAAAVDAFLRRLRSEAPPLSVRSPTGGGP